MRRISRSTRGGALAAALIIAVAFAFIAPASATPPPGAHVYVQTNGAAGNQVVSFARATDGSLTQEQIVSTGGLGIGPASLGSQASLAVTGDDSHLLAVNAGSDDVSLFDIAADGLHLADLVHRARDCKRLLDR